MSSKPLAKILVIDPVEQVADCIEQWAQDEPQIACAGWIPTLLMVQPAIYGARPNVLLTELEPDVEASWREIRQVRRLYPKVRVVMYSHTTTTETLDHALAAGAAGYISKDEPGAMVMAVCLAVAKGRNFVSPMVDRALRRANGLASS